MQVSDGCLFEQVEDDRMFNDLLCIPHPSQAFGDKFEESRCHIDHDGTSVVVCQS